MDSGEVREKTDFHKAGAELAFARLDWLDARACCSCADQNYYQAIQLAIKAGLVEEAETMSARLEEIRTVCQSPFSATGRVVDTELFCDLANRATDQLGEGDYRAANDLYTRAIELNPSRSYLYRQRAMARYELADYQDALADCHQAIQKDLDLDDARDCFFLRGRVLWKLGDRDSALVDFDRCLEYFTIATGPTPRSYYSIRGLARSEMGDPIGALADFYEYLDAGPRFTGNEPDFLDNQPESHIAHYQIGLALNAIGDWRGGGLPAPGRVPVFSEGL